MPRHSIIIPHRNRRAYLSVCLDSIARSVAACGVEQPEILVIGDDDDSPIFNKPRQLNRGIEQATGDVLTFLDCDAIVGLRWAECVHLLDWSSLHRACYRVRYVPKSSSDLIIAGQMHADEFFGRYDSLQLAYEAYGRPSRNAWKPGGQPWGNSQFSMPRDRIGDMRFDERFEGRGFEDLEFLRRLYEAEPKYHATIFTDPDHALLHLKHDYATDWSTKEIERDNLNRYILCRQ